ncbi:acetylglutamate kinase [Salisediminibacterium halotolerans]|uniref:Acetylglutamate kinase n=1 Tax=Salisediminibacterium halotolerans TaxID=517425 RepID=A0A1H9RPK7_9BACI|nr:acetylglutamate kinase [Salisediminibacterium haloalkalitolerans]SER74415.1 acetylglutamate kinase [Salisediminibacterium haloalkalitolerans]
MNPIVIKLGGSLLDPIPDELCENIASFCANEAIDPLIVHGGGPHVSEMLEKLDVPTSFTDGLRVTDAETLNVAEMVLSGTVNKQLTRKLQHCGVHALGISGTDGDILSVEPLDKQALGYVGDITCVNPALLHSLLQASWVPVISPLGSDEQHEAYNINADTAASAIAAKLDAPLIYLTDVDGVMEETEEGWFHHNVLTASASETLIDQGIIYGGMIPKVQAALTSIEKGVNEVIILNGKQPSSLSDYQNAANVGTKFIKEDNVYHV